MKGARNAPVLPVKLAAVILIHRICFKETLTSIAPASHWRYEIPAESCSKGVYSRVVPLHIVLTANLQYASRRRTLATGLSSPSGVVQ